MKRSHLLIPVLFAVVLTSGCQLLKREKKPVEKNTPAAETDEILRQRWVDKRTAELVAQGTAPEAARPLAEQEFRAKYNYTKPAQ